MGYPYDELVPAAILLDHPGITKEEFVRLLGETDVYGGEIRRYTKDAEGWDYYFRQLSEEEREKLIRKQNLVRWDLRDTERHSIQMDKFHAGVYGLTRLLNINQTTQQFIDMQRSLLKEDEFGFQCGVPRLAVIRVRDRVWRDPEYEVETILESKLDEDSPSIEGQVVICRNLKLKRGELLLSGDLEIGPREIIDRQGKFRAFLLERCSKLRTREENRYNVRVRGISGGKRTERYKNIEELTTAYPQFDPDFAVDFSRKEGVLSPDCPDSWGIYHGEPKWKWKQTNGRYYLDKDYVYDRIPASFTCQRSGRFGYHDLILTAEAIRNKAWKLLTYKGLQHLQNFFVRFPESRERYERAVMDSFTSLYAKEVGMTNSELLRFRLLARIGN